MRKNIARRLAMLLALVVLVTTCGSDYNSISVRATSDEAILEQEKSTENDYSDLFTEEIGAEQSQEEAPAEEISEEPVEESVEEPAQEEVTEPVEEAPAEESQEVVQEEPAQEAPAEDAAPAEEYAEAPAETPTEEAPAEEAPAPEEPAPETPEEVPAEAPAETVETPAEARNVTVTYTATKGGKVSKGSETIDLNAEGATFEGATASAKSDKYEFVNWTDANGNEVGTDPTFVPSNIEADASFTANFKLVEGADMPELSVSDVHAGGLIVSVRADDGIFPAGTEVLVKPISNEQALETAQGELGESVTSAVGVDITFLYEGSPIQPADDKYVYVNMALEEKIEGESFTVLHDHNGEVNAIEDATIKSEDANSDPADDTKVLTEVEFKSNEFSIYIVAGSEETKRVKVIFKNGNTEIASMYVKQNDDMEQVIYDPGVGEQPDGTVFKGWKNVSDTEENLLTIEQVRDEVTGMLPPENDGEEVVYQAVFTSGYTITYVDEKGTSLGQHIVEYPAGATGDALNVDYTINMAYTPEDDEHNFEGWFITEASSANVVKINGEDYTYSAGTPYDNGTKMTIKGSVTLSVNSPKGHWLVYESGKGGTYVAPDFVYSDAVTVDKTQDPTKPEDPTKIQMKKNGYTFGGWYTDETYSTKFTFGEALSDKTTIYAKWIPNETAGYTVLIWKEKLDGGYEFATSRVGTGKVGDSIADTAIEVGTTGELKYVTIGGKKFGGIVSVPNGTTSDPLTGFTYDATLTEDKTINPEGTAVANIYFKRMEYTVKLYVTKRSGNQLRGSNVEGGQGYSGDWSLSLNRVTKINGQEPIQENPYYYFPITAKYGADISSSWPTYATIDSSREFISWILMKNAKMYAGQGSGKNTVKGNVGVMDEQILGDLSDSDGNYLTARYNNNSTVYNWTYYIYFKDVDGNYIKQDGTNGTVDLTVQAKSAQSGNDSQHEPPFDGYVYEKKDGYSVTGTNCTISFYYKPKEYTILYNDGVYGKGDDSEFVVEDNLSNLELATRENILVGSSLKDYDITPDHANKDGYVFDGWYLDESCREDSRFDFEDHVMPVGGLVLYAKWRKIQYRVFLHPTLTKEQAPDLNWHGQALSFRVDYGDKISSPTGIATGYVLMGWYRNEGLTDLFNEAYVLNEDTVTEAYDWDNHKTDTMDNWGNGAKDNKDKDYNRWWITKEYNLYAKWRRVIDGADGVDVVYDLTDPDAGTGTGTAVDNNSYVDNASATAVPAVKAPEGYQFSHWVMQKYVNDKYVDVDGSVIYPGSEYKVLVANAKKEKKTDENGNDVLDDEGKNRYTYTIQLRAEYKKLGEATPTYIPWFKNDGSAVFHVDTLDGAGKYDLDINAAVDIQTAPTRTGYTFAGWGKVSMGRSAAEADNFMNTADNWTQDSPTPFLYYKDGSFYSDEACTKAATKVAADEAMPYEAIFAIWERYYTVEYYKGEITNNTDTAHYLGKAENLGPIPVGQTTITLQAGTGAGQLNYKKADAGNSYKDGEQVPKPYPIVEGENVVKVLYPANKIIVTVKGSKAEYPYDGTEHSVTGFTVTAKFEDGTPIENVSASDFVYDGDTAAKTTIKGTNVSDSAKIDFDVTKFSGTPAGYEGAKIEFVLDADQPGNELVITPIGVTVKITGNHDRKEYNGQEQSVTGYIPEISGGNGEYTEDMFEYTGDATAKGTDVTPADQPYPMNLDMDKFENKNTSGNFTVTFELVKDGYLEIYAKAITVKITGKNKTVDYDTQYHEVEGYTAKAVDNPDYPVDTAISYDGTTKIREKDVKRKADSEVVDKYPMNLDISKFSNTDTNYDVTFALEEDGWLQINPISVTVYVKGDQKTFPYDTNYHEADGWDFEEPLSELVTKDNVTLKTNADGTRKDYIREKDVKRNQSGETDKYMMGLVPTDFECTDTNITVTFVVNDGWLMITPQGTVTVEITGDVQEADYDKQPHTATGYTFKASDENYTADDFTFDSSSFEKVDENGMPVIEKEDVNRDESGNVIPYPMGLADTQFTNTNGNYEEVIFTVVEDGKLTIKPVEVTVTITGHKKTVRYNGKEQSVTGYDKSCSSSELFNVEEVEYEGSDSAEGTNHGTYPMNLDKDKFGPTHTNNLDIKYEVTDGELVIDPLQISLEIIGNNNIEYYDGTEKYAEGYTVNNPQILPPPEGKEYYPSEEDPDLTELYDESKVKYNGEAKAKGTLVNDEKNVEYPDHYPMNLDATKFSYEDESGNIEATFTIGADGKLIILPRIDGNEIQLTLITEDDVQEFSGKTWTGADYTYKIKAEKPDAGFPERMIGAVKNLLDNILGVLHVHAADDSKGKEFEVDGVKFYLQGFGVRVGDDDAARDVDKYKLNITETGPFVVLDAEGNDVTENFAIKEFEEGDLTITKKRITLISGSAQKVYDGTPLTEHSVTESTNWGEGDAVTYNFTGSQTEVGESDNLFTAKAANELTKLEKNYIVEYVPGKLKVTQNPDTPPEDPKDPDKKDKKEKKPTTDKKRYDEGDSTNDNSSNDNGGNVLGARREPAAPESPAVLGAKRDQSEQPAVLGARRGGTDDKTDTSRVLVLLIAAGAVATLLATDKRRKKNEE